MKNVYIIADIFDLDENCDLGEVSGHSIAQLAIELDGALGIVIPKICIAALRKLRAGESIEKSFKLPDDRKYRVTFSKVIA